jgi:hypothetical protein
VRPALDIAILRAEVKHIPVHLSVDH